MERDFELAEVLADIRSLKAECEMLLRLNQTLAEDEGKTMSEGEVPEAHPTADLIYLA